MKTLRLIDWLKLAPMMMAAALVIGCGAAEDATVEPADAPIGADVTTETEDVIVEEPIAPAELPAVEPAADPAAEPATP